MACCQIEDTQTLVGDVFWQVQESSIRKHVAVANSELTKLTSLLDQRRDRSIRYLSTLIEVDLKHGRTAFGNGQNRFVRYQGTIVQFQLEVFSL